MEELKQFLVSKGVTAGDLGKAVIIHEVLGVSILLTAWAGCWAVKPSKHLVRALQLRQSEQWRRLEPRIQQSKFVKMIKESKHLSPKTAGDLTIAFGESYFLRKLAMPVLIPLKLWLTYELVIMTKTKDEGLSSLEQ